MHHDFYWSLCSQNPLKIISFFLIAIEASIKGVDGEKAILLELPLLNILSRREVLWL